MVTAGQQGSLKENLTELHIIVRTTGSIHNDPDHFEVQSSLLPF